MITSGSPAGTSVLEGLAWRYPVGGVVRCGADVDARQPAYTRDGETYDHWRITRPVRANAHDAASDGGRRRVVKGSNVLWATDPLQSRFEADSRCLDEGRLRRLPIVLAFDALTLNLDLRFASINSDAAVTCHGSAGIAYRSAPWPAGVMPLDELADLLDGGHPGSTPVDGRDPGAHKGSHDRAAEVVAVPCKGPSRCDFARHHGCGAFARMVFRLEGQPGGEALYLLRTGSRHAAAEMLGVLSGLSARFAGWLADLPLWLELVPRHSNELGGTFWHPSLRTRFESNAHAMRSQRARRRQEARLGINRAAEEQALLANARMHIRVGDRGQLGFGDLAEDLARYGPL